MPEQAHSQTLDQSPAGFDDRIGLQLAMSALTGRQLISRCAELSHPEHPNEYAAVF
jgi:hypothetical protein